MIFVFGSNLAGVHGAGAARVALLKHSAKMGIGVGITGYSYALPTKDENIETRSLPEVKNSVEEFLSYAANHSENDFQVTRIGCGLAGFTDAEIAPLFADAPANCLFDEAWKEFLPTAAFWGTF